MDIQRLLPKNQYDAAIGANSPSASNVFATVNDIPAPDGNGIYSGSGNVNNPIITNLTGNGVYIDASSASASEYILKLRSNTGVELNRFRNSGRVDLATNGATTTIGAALSNYYLQNVNESRQYSSSATFTGFVSDRSGTKVSMRAQSNGTTSLTSTNPLGFYTSWGGNFGVAGTLAMHIDNNQNVGIGLASVFTTPSARFHIKSANSTGTGRALKVDDSLDVENFYVTDGGNIGANNGDIETLLSTKGFVVKDRTDGNRYRIYTDNGVINTELV